MYGGIPRTNDEGKPPDRLYETNRPPILSTDHPEGMLVDKCGHYLSSKLTERAATFLTCSELTDVTFIVGEGENRCDFRAHKLILAMGSPVFKAMFFGPLTERSDLVAIPDSHPDAFRALLWYLYTDELRVADGVLFQALEMSGKYMVSHMVQECSAKLAQSLNQDNVCQMYQHAVLCGETALAIKCLMLLDQKASYVLNSEGFMMLSYTLLETILKRDNLKIESEHEVFNAALRWVEKACAKLGLAGSAENKRNVLGQALQLIRFSRMPIEEFADGPAKSGILTKDELADYFMYMTMRGNRPPALKLEAAVRAPPRNYFSMFFVEFGSWLGEYMCVQSNQLLELQFRTNLDLLLLGIGSSNTNLTSSFRCVEVLEDSKTIITREQQLQWCPLPASHETNNLPVKLDVEASNSSSLAFIKPTLIRRGQDYKMLIHTVGRGLNPYPANTTIYKSQRDLICPNDVIFTITQYERRLGNSRATTAPNAACLSEINSLMFYC